MPTLLELFSCDGWLGFGFLGGLVSQPSAAGHSQAAFFVDVETDTVDFRYSIDLLE
jgi:hypothetical protein